MSLVTVYQYEVWDPNKRAYVRARTHATQQAIEQADGVLLPHTAQQVDASLVSPDGVLVRWPCDGTG
jgi:hypothetical protein